jgi:hypothetical protein
VIGDDEPIEASVSRGTHDLLRKAEGVEGVTGVAVHIDP